MQAHNHSCNRCTTPLGRIVTLHSCERVCGACIEETGGVLPVAALFKPPLGLSPGPTAADFALSAEQGGV